MTREYRDMDFRERLDIHLKKYPFIQQDMLNGDKTAYGMFLFQEAEFLTRNSGVIREYLNVKTYITHHDEIPNPEFVDFVVLWGVSDVDPNIKHLFGYAELYQKPILIIEDGFIRSYFPMSYGELSASVRFDSEGCYYDANYPSAIENFLNSDFELTPHELNEVRALIDRIVEWNITKYNLSKKYEHRLAHSTNYESIVLVIDQVYGDMSIQKGGVCDEDFDKILRAALEENPNSLLLVKQHPESVLGIRKGHFDNNLLDNTQIRLISDDINPISMIKCVDKVYCATTQMGFEALLCGKNVQCFGKPFYAGWGLTVDRQNIPRRLRSRSIEELFFASYIYNTVYLNPKTKQKCNIGDIINYFVSNKSDANFFLKLQNDFLELRIKRLERKVLEIEPLKDTSIKFDDSIKKLNNGFFVRLEDRFLRDILKLRMALSELCCKFLKNK